MKTHKGQSLEGQDLVSRAPTPGGLKGSLRVYPTFTRMLTPLVDWHLGARVRRGKEDPARLGERKGYATRTRPAGGLVWVHAASVGESLSILDLIRRLLSDNPSLQVMITTGTVTSATLLEERLPERAFHHYVPLDHPAYVRRFINHWRPDLALWVESEFWPNLMGAMARSGRPLVLVNARISERSFNGWRRFPGSIRALLDQFSLCLAPDAEIADRLSALGARRVMTTGNLKHCAPPLPADPGELETLRGAINGRPLWLAASVHEEADALLKAHSLVVGRHPGLLTVVAPRQPDRGPELAKRAQSEGIKAKLRSENGGPGADTDFYVADTMGELGLFFRLTDIAFLGRSLSAFGGSNPLEAARLNCAILHGPHVSNFGSIYAELDEMGAALRVHDAASLGEGIDRLLSDPQARRLMASKAETRSEATRGILDRVVTALDPYLPNPAKGETRRDARA